MTLDQFKSSLTSSVPPAGLSAELRALWHDGKGDWNKSHDVAQEINTNSGSWIHAYLHRKEGDLGNATYWYSRAGKKMPSYSLEQEWTEIVTAFL